MEALPSVKHQLVSLDIFPEERYVRGYCEITAACPKDKQVLGLHAYGLNIKGISVDGLEATYELVPPFEEALPEQVLDGPSGADLAVIVADHAFFQYERTLQREYNSELVIHLPAPQALIAVGSADAVEMLPPKEDPAGSLAADAKPAPGTDVRIVCVRAEYELQQSAAGLCFTGSYAHTSNQLRRARAWMPCVDAPNAACPYDIHITVSKDQTAVASGQLLKQTWTAQHRKKFYFSLPQATTASQVAFAVGPFAIVDGTSPPAAAGIADACAAESPTIATYLAPHNCLADLKHTIKFFHLALGFFEGQLGASFPLTSYHQVFMPSDSINTEPIVGMGICIASTDLLFNDRTIEQAVESMLALVRALAQQWMGVWLRPKVPSDDWLLQGLCAHLTNLFIGKYLGRNEILFRRGKEKEAIYTADDGSAPPLHLLQRSERQTKIAAYPWGALQATEHLGPGAEFREMKAAAVIHMLERRAGEDNFKRLLQRLLAVSHNSAATPGGIESRLLTTMDFLREVAKIGGIRHEVSAIYKRWVLGRGCPKITGAYFYNRKRSVLELAIQQCGNAASKAAAEDASGSGKEGSSAGILKAVKVKRDMRAGLRRHIITKVLVKESEGPGEHPGLGIHAKVLEELKVTSKPAKVLVKEAEGPVEHLVKVGTHAKVLEELKVTSKPAKVKGKPGRRKQKVAVEDLDDDGAEADEPVGEALPVEWVRLDPGNELIALIRLRQPEPVLAAQLERSKDVLAQSAAITGLAAIRPVTYGVINALRACMQSSNFYCRVRMEAAMALGQVAGQSPDATGLDHLLRFCQSRLFDATLGMPASWQFADLAEHYLNQALPLALAAARDVRGNAFKDALELLLDVLEHVDNSGNIYDPDNFLAAALDALGRMHTDDAEMREGVLRQLQRYWKREMVMPSKEAIVGCTALRSMTRLVCSQGCDVSDRQRLLIMLAKSVQDASMKQLRGCALQCSIRVTCCARGFDNAVTYAASLLKANERHRDRQSIMEEVLALLPTDEGGLKKISKNSLVVLHGMLSWHGSPELRHLAFVALMRLGRQAPTLFRKDDDPAQDATAAPSMSVDTAFPRQLPAASGPAMSFDSGGKSSRRPPVLKFKSSFLGAPSKSHRAAGSEALSEERSVDAARPSAGIGREPSVSQPPAARAAALEQEVVSSPIHPAGAGQEETQEVRPGGLKIKQSWAKPAPAPSEDAWVPSSSQPPQVPSQPPEAPSLPPLAPSQPSLRPKISFGKKRKPDAEGSEAPRKRLSVTLPGAKVSQQERSASAGQSGRLPAISESPGRAATASPFAEAPLRVPSPLAAAAPAPGPRAAEQLQQSNERSNAARARLPLSGESVPKQAKARKGQPKAPTMPPDEGVALPASSAPAQQKQSAKRKRSPSPLVTLGLPGMETDLQQGTGSQKSRPKSGSKEKNAPTLSPEQEQAREAMLRDVMAIASKHSPQTAAPAPKKAKTASLGKSSTGIPKAPSISPPEQAPLQSDIFSRSRLQTVQTGSLPSSAHGAGAKPEMAAQSSAQAAPTSSLPSSAPASAKPKGFKIKLGRGASAGPPTAFLGKGSSKSGPQSGRPSPGSTAGPASIQSSATASAPAKQGLKVRFLGLKAPAAATATPEPKPELSKEEEKKRAKLRKAQKALGI